MYEGRLLNENKSKAKVAVVRCTHYEQEVVDAAVARQFELLGGVGKFVKRGDWVLVKPNFIAPRSHRFAAQTHPSVVYAVVKLLKDFGARPFVGDSPAWANVHACVEALRLTGPLRDLGVPVAEFHKPVWQRIGKSRTKIGIAPEALDADVIINLPKLKMHQQMVATFAVKNMFGCVPGKRKALWHFTRGRDWRVFSQMLIDIYEHVRPAVNLVDAVIGMEGSGPIKGDNRELGWLIGSVDAIACETICCELIDMDPEEPPILRMAREIGFGCGRREDIETVGDDYSGHICRDFKRAEPSPIMFSLVHVCKSVFRQAVLLAKAKKKG